MPEQPVSAPAADTPPSDGVPGPLAAPDPADPAASPADDANPAGTDLELPVEAEADSGKFTVRLTNFTGPFDLLLQLIGKHKLDVTEIALHQVTDDFIAYIRAMGDDWDLGETSEFLLVAATLLDLKAARLLPSAEVEDEDDLALLEAGDLLFARLLQYKAYKEAAAVIADLEGIGARRWPRAVTLEPRYAEALPDLVLGFGPERLLKLALKQFLPKPGPPEVSIAHIHQVRVSVREHATLIRDRLRRAGSATFSLLIADCENTLEVVARFLALLELYREGLIDFEQPVSLEEMTVRWIGGDQAEADLDIDDYEGTPQEPDTAALDPDDPDLDPAAEAPVLDLDEDEEDDEDEEEDVDYAALADAALAARREGQDPDDAEPDERDPAETDTHERDPAGVDSSAGVAVPEPADDDRGTALGDAESDEDRPADRLPAEIDHAHLDDAEPNDAPAAGADSEASEREAVVVEVDGAEPNNAEVSGTEPEPPRQDAALVEVAESTEVGVDPDAVRPEAVEDEAAEPSDAELAGAEPGASRPDAARTEPGLAGADEGDASVSGEAEADVPELGANPPMVGEPGPADFDQPAQDESGLVGPGHRTADRVSNNEEQS